MWLKIAPLLLRNLGHSFPRSLLAACQEQGSDITAALQRGRGARGTCKALSVIITCCGPPSAVLCTCAAPWGQYFLCEGWEGPDRKLLLSDLQIVRKRLAPRSLSQRGRTAGCRFSSSARRVREKVPSQGFPRMHCNSFTEDV